MRNELFVNTFPNITRWVTEQGWIEIGQDENSTSRGSTSAAEFWGHLMVYIVSSIFIRLFISNWNSPYGVMCP
jgi:hypothetical protein